MSEEIIINNTNDVYKYSPDEIYDYIEQLQQQNKELENELLDYKLHIEYTPCSHELINGNELLAKLFTENKELKEQIKLFKQDLVKAEKTCQNYKNRYYDDKLITNKFESWLEEQLKREIEHPTPEVYCNCAGCCKRSLDKLKKLKGDVLFVNNGETTKKMKGSGE